MSREEETDRSPDGKRPFFQCDGPLAAGSVPRIGIVGGHGRMGRWFARLLEEAGLPVSLADRDTPLCPEDLAASCDVVIVSVPMDVFPEIVASIGPIMPEHAFLTDLCSLKRTQVATMLAHSTCAVMGTHPLFGPGEESLAGRRIALCPGRGKRWLSWWDGFLAGRGAITHIVEADTHDRIMAWVQALNHYLLLSMGKAIQEEGLDLALLQALATPSFELQMRIVSRLAVQDPELYATIQMDNPHTDEVLARFSTEAERIRGCIRTRDRDLFIRIFKEVQDLGRRLFQEGESPRV